jgi:hypothetical protein
LRDFEQLLSNALRRLVGDYQNDSGISLRILQRGNRLYAKMQRQPEFPLEAEAPTLPYNPKREWA